MSKSLVLMRDVICQYHPEFVQNCALQKFALDMPKRFNIEHLIEETLAHVGRLKFVDAEGYDFLPDYSDSKTVTVNSNTRVAEINSVENKIGAIRITAYNPFKDGVDFFFVPKSDLSYVKEPCYGLTQSFKERIKFTYSKKSDNYGWFEDYRVESFKRLAIAR
jgi:hypothetical protein